MEIIIKKNDKRAKKNLNWLFFFRLLYYIIGRFSYQEGMEKNVIKKQLPQGRARGWAQILGADSLFIFVFWNTCFCFRKFVYLFVFWNGLGVFSFVWLGFTQQQHNYNSRRAVVLKMASAKNGIRIIISIQNYIDKKVSISLPWDGTNRETKWNFLLFFSFGR